MNTMLFYIKKDSRVKQLEKRLDETSELKLLYQSLDNELPLKSKKQRLKPGITGPSKIPLRCYNKKTQEKLHLRSFHFRNSGVSKRNSTTKRNTTLPLVNTTHKKCTSL